MKMAKTKAEYNVLVRHTHLLQQVLENHLEDLPYDLYSRELITRQQLDKALERLRPRGERAAELVDDIQTSVEIESQRYYTFIDILTERYSRSLGDVAEMLKKAPDTYDVAVEQKPAEPPRSGHNQPGKY